MVDDNEVNRHLFQKLLCLWGMKPVLASGAMAAIREYAAEVRSRAFPGPQHVYPMRTKAK